MKTFEQFRAWMKDMQIWNEYLTEFYAQNENHSPRQIYTEHPETILDHSFAWWESLLGYSYWFHITEQWKEFYNMKNYQLVYVNERVACVRMPKQATAVQIGFVKSALQKENPEITDFDWEDGNLYGIVKHMQLEKI